MFKTLISKTIKLLTWVLALYSVYMLLRGHNDPGGGFIGGLVLTLAAILYHSFADQKSFLSTLTNHFHILMGLLLILLIIVAAIPVFLEAPFLKGLWSKVPIPIAGKFSSILVFDGLIYLLVGLGVFHSYFLINDIDLFLEKKE